jgi:ferrous iron transport protein A
MHAYTVPLSQLPPGSTARVRALASEGITRRRMLDLGLVDNTEIKVLLKGPLGEPAAFLIRGAVIALRSDETSKIFVDTL